MTGCPYYGATLEDFSRMACVATEGADGLVRIDHSACGRFASCHTPPAVAAYHRCRHCEGRL